MSRRSPLADISVATRKNLSLGGVSNMSIVATSEYEPGQTMLCDLSAVRKRIVIGATASNWLSQHTGTCPSSLFETQPLEAGGLVVRIHRDQYVLIDGYNTEQYDEFFTLPAGRHGDVLVLDYECAEMVLAGPQVENIVSELCPMPTENIAAGYWCATRMAHADVAMLPVELPSRHYRIMTTPADARFVYQIFNDAIAEYDGMQIGYHNYWQDFLN